MTFIDYSFVSSSVNPSRPRWSTVFVDCIECLHVLYHRGTVCIYLLLHSLLSSVSGVIASESSPFLNYPFWLVLIGVVYWNLWLLDLCWSSSVNHSCLLINVNWMPGAKLNKIPLLHYAMIYHSGFQSFCSHEILSKAHKKLNFLVTKCFPVGHHRMMWSHDLDLSDQKRSTRTNPFPPLPILIF